MKFVLIFITAAMGANVTATQAQTAVYSGPTAYGVQTAPTRYGPHGATARQYGDTLVITRPHKSPMICHDYADRQVCN